MRFFSDIIRVAAFCAALYAFYIGRGSAGIFIVITIAVTVVFRCRKIILLDDSDVADWWEFFAVLLFLANAILLVTGLYYAPRFWFIDIPLHFWGGIVAGSWAYLSIRNTTFFRDLDWVRRFLFIVGVAALVGIGWEFFEWISDHVMVRWYVFPKNQPSVTDTMKDLLMDLLGGSFGGFLFQHRNTSQS